MKEMNKESRLYHSIKNIATGYIYQLVMIFLTFISRTVFIHYLGVEYLGLNSIFLDILNMLSLADLGLSSAMTYSFYKPLSDNDKNKIAGLIGFYKRVYLIIAVAISVLGIIVIPFLKYIVNFKYKVDGVNVYYVLSLANVVASYLYIYKTSIIIADQKNYIINSINTVLSVFKNIVQIISILIFRSYLVYLLVGIISTILTNYISSKRADKLYPYINQKEILSKKEKKSVYQTLKSVSIYKLSSVLLNATDNTIISVLMGTVIVGYYSNYFMLSSKITQMVALVFTSITASIGNVIVKESSKKRYEIFCMEQAVSFVISGIIVSSFIVMASDFIKVWLGKTFVLDMKVVIVIGINMYLSVVLQPLWSYREATGLYVKTKWIMLYAAIINIILSIILGKIIGLMGVLLASAISRIVTYVWYEPVILFKKYFNVKTIKYFKGILYNVLATSMITLLNLFFLRNVVANSWVTLTIKGIICFLISSIVFVLIYVRSNGMNLLLSRLHLNNHHKHF
nr:hypothetical protein [Ligilactobacillus ruminis]